MAVGHGLTENVILHVGTNDLKATQLPQQVAENIINLAVQIEGDSPNTQVSISAICFRKEVELWKKAVEINKLAKRFCRNRGWPFLPNENIDSSCLNRIGLHLNSKGASNLSGRPARFQTSNFIGPYNLHRLLLSGLGLLFRSLPIVLLDQS